MKSDKQEQPPAPEVSASDTLDIAPPPELASVPSGIAAGR